jgi:MFS family permease
MACQSQADIAGESGAVVSLFTGGGFIGAGLAGPCGDLLGRRLTIMIGALIFCLGGALQAAGSHLNFFYAGRAVGGLGVGFLVMIVPMYQAEISHPSIRGRVTGLQQFMLGIGAVVASKSFAGSSTHTQTEQGSNVAKHGLYTAPTSTTTIISSGASLLVCRSSRPESSRS